MDWTIANQDTPIPCAGSAPGVRSCGRTSLCLFIFCLLVGLSALAANGQSPYDTAPLPEPVAPELVETDVLPAYVLEHLETKPTLQPCDPLESLPPTSPRGSCDTYLDPYRLRATEIVEGEPTRNSWTAATEPEIKPAGEMRMWWDDLIDRPLGFSPQTLSLDVQALTSSALVHSPLIQSVLAEPQIRQTDVTIADADFDTLLFLQTKFADNNDPVGNELTTGDNSRRFRDQTWNNDLGIRRRTRTGGEFEVIQRGGYQDNNSLFLQPNPQGTTRLEINYTQPLKKDGGRAVNRTRIVVAQLQANQATSEARSSLENHLLDVTRAYWELYQFRALWLQQQKLVGSARELYDLLDSRREFDAGMRHILRARAALASRQTGLARAAARIRDAQSRLRMLVSSRELVAATSAEWTTGEKPLSTRLPVSTKQSVIEALEHRNDITASIQAIHEVSVRVGAAKNQVLPQLDMLLGTYVAGLSPGRDPFGAFAKQFSEGRPGYFVGLAYEMPVGNRAARSRLNKNRWELFQVIQDFRQVTESAITEVEIAARETATAYSEMLEKKLAIDASESEVAYLTQRYEELPGQEDSLVLLVDNLLDAQERLADQESEFVQSQTAYAVSWVMLRKATGTLLQFDRPDNLSGSNAAPPPVANGEANLP